MKSISYFHYFFLSILFINFSCKSQPSSPFAPEAGEYKGGTLSVAATYSYGYNAITGFGVQSTPNAQYMPSPMGDLIISNSSGNKGKYHFSKMQNLAGEWQYDVNNNRLNFTGILKDALTYYKASKGLYSMGFNIHANKDDKQGVHYEYSKKASKAFPKMEKPNGNLQGFITIMPDGHTVNIFDVKKGKTTVSFNGKMPITNLAHQTITVGYVNDPHFYEIGITSSSGNTATITAERSKSFGWNFLDYKFGILNNNGSKMGLLGKTKDDYSNLTYTPGYACIGVVDINTGKQLGALPMADGAYIRPFFFNDDRILFSPKEGGIAVSANNYNDYKTIYSNKINALALSPDNKQIAFSEGIYFYTMNVDGSNKKQINCGGEPVTVIEGDDVSDMCWSPDGNYIALCVRANSHLQIAVLPTDGSDFTFIKDEDGDVLRQENILMSWH